MDAQLFTSFSDPYQCRMLLQEITTRPGFLPEATWLLGHETGCCGTLQCGSDDNSTASIQNIGIIPEHRGLGLGYIFLLQGLHCLRERGFRRVYLEVTAENTAAVQLYLKLGFRKVKTLFRAVGGIQHGFETSVW
jgi:ribosomal protein S18 acetylase RimI-like enzyme